MRTLEEGALLAGRNLRRLVASPRLMVSSLVFPLLLMVFIWLAFADMVTGVVGGEYIDRLAPLMVLYTAAFGSLGTGLGLYADLRTGLVDRIRSLPVRRASFLVGRVGADLVRVLGLAVAVTLVATVLGFRFSQGLSGALAFFGLVLAFGSMFIWVAMVVALRARSVDGVVGMLNGPLTLLLFLATGFAPLEAFPAALQPVVWANPLTQAGDALRGLAGGGPVMVPLCCTLVWVVVVSALAAPAAVTAFRRRIP